MYEQVNATFSYMILVLAHSLKSCRTLKIVIYKLRHEAHSTSVPRRVS